MLCTSPRTATSCRMPGIPVACPQIHKISQGLQDDFHLDDLLDRVKGMKTAIGSARILFFIIVDVCRSEASGKVSWVGRQQHITAQKDQTFPCTGHGLPRRTTCHSKWGEWWAAYLSFTATLDAGPTITVFPSQDTTHRPENIWLPVSLVGNPQHAI